MSETSELVDTLGRQLTWPSPQEETAFLRTRIKELEHEVEVLRLAGNKDCIAMADEILGVKKN